MISKNRTVISKELVFGDLVKAARKNLIPRFILAAVILVLGIIVMVAGRLASNNTYFALGAFFVACSLVYVILGLVSMKKAPKDIEKSNPDLDAGDLTYNFTFKEGGFEALLVNEKRKNSLKYDYKNVKSVTEYKDKYDIILKENKILYIYKSGFIGEKAEEIFKINLEKNKIKIKSKIE